MENGHIVNVTKNVLLEECDQETVGSRLGKENSEKMYALILHYRFSCHSH